MLPVSKVAEAALEAACLATQHHQSQNKVSTELGSRSEAWFVSYIGIAVNDAIRAHHKHSNDSGVYVTFEARVDWIDSYLGRKNEDYLTPAQRFDLSIWNDGVSICGLIEVKNAPNMNKNAFVDDAAKLERGLERWSGVRCAPKWALYIYTNRVPALTTEMHGSSADYLKCRSMSVEKDVRQELIKSYVGGGHRKMASRDTRCKIMWTALPIRLR